MKVLALDFDGVISDSAVESFAVALRTYVKLRPASKLQEVAREIARSSPEALRIHPLYRDFLDLMPLGNRAEDFAVALEVIESGSAVSTRIPCVATTTWNRPMCTPVLASATPRSSPGCPQCCACRGG